MEIEITRRGFGKLAAQAIVAISAASVGLFAEKKAFATGGVVPIPKPVIVGECGAEVCVPVKVFHSVHSYGAMSIKEAQDITERQFRSMGTHQRYKFTCYDVDREELPPTGARYEEIGDYDINGVKTGVFARNIVIDGKHCGDGYIRFGKPKSEINLSDVVSRQIHILPHLGI